MYFFPPLQAGVFRKNKEIIQKECWWGDGFLGGTVGVPWESSLWPLWWGMGLPREGSAVEATWLRLQALNFLECWGLKGLRASGGCFWGWGRGIRHSPPSFFPSREGEGAPCQHSCGRECHLPEIRRWIFKISGGWHGQCQQLGASCPGRSTASTLDTGPPKGAGGAGRGLPVLGRTSWL